MRDELRALTKKLTPLYPNTAAITAQWLMSFITGKSSAELITQADKPLSASETAHLESVLNQLLIEHKPLQYSIGTVPFLELDIAIRPPILIPRPETEYWCSLIIDQLTQLNNQELTILDMCTGSGCIALSLAHALPKSQVYAVDISEQACALAEENARRNRIENVTIIRSDLFAAVPEDLRFDLIVSNPPYISAHEWASLDQTVKRWEDIQALVAEEDGLSLLKKIITQAPARLVCNEEMNENGIEQLVVEIGHTQGPAVAALFEKAGFHTVTIHQDQAGRDRFVTAHYTKCL